MFRWRVEQRTGKQGAEEEGKAATRRGEKGEQRRERIRAFSIAGAALEGRVQAREKGGVLPW
jgi:hypothetical protein